jgi:uncharacterized protein (DUF1501 family)
MPRKTEPDALKRLLDWEKQGFALTATLGLSLGREPAVNLRRGNQPARALASGKTFADAIHAALDAAEATEK